MISRSGSRVAARSHRVDRSGGEALAAFRATTVQDGTTTLGGHTGAEAVGTLALQYAGLKSSFHDCLPIYKKQEGLAAPKIGLGPKKGGPFY